MKIRLYLSLVILLVSALFSPSMAHSEKLLPETPGVYERSLKTGDLKLRFGIEVPKADGSQTPGSPTPRPLVLALHYGFDSSRAFPHYYGKDFMERVVSPGLEALGAYIVAPDSHGMPWTDAKIGASVLELLDVLIADPRIDAKKVIVTGYSMGGTGTWYFAAKFTERFAAAIPMAGRLRAEWIEETAGLPIHVLHSRDDELVSLEQVREILEAKKAENISFSEIQGVTHFQSPQYSGPLAELIVPWLEEKVSVEASSGE